ncbi:MAG: peptidase S10 [Candidatus Aquilonibacter sp.]|jgi:carboxypeptidase C (cathepsin A)
MKPLFFAFVLALLPIRSLATDAVTQHTLTMNGRVIHYTARAGTITLYDEKRQPIDTMFYTAYTQDGVNPSTRPVTFFYNGGPGGSSVWQRMAAFGPVRVIGGKPGETPSAPYTVVDNQYSLLDKTDEVYVDAPATGFSRMLAAGKGSQVFGIDQDAAAFAQFIRSYLSDFGRWNSPKYLFGESYGTVRSAAVARQLENGFGQAIQLNGIVSMSNALNLDVLWDDENVGGNDWAFVLFLPTEAATAWYYHLVPNRPADLATFLASVEHFALGEYLTTLAQGDNVAPATREDTIQKLAAYTGLSESVIREANLRIKPNDFRSDLLRSQGKVVGYMDTRYSGYDVVGNRQSPMWDNSDLATTPAVVSIFNDYVRNQLGYHTPLEYRPLYDVLAGWDWKHATDLGGDAALIKPPNTIVDLAEAMAENPSMRVLALMGYYDMSTPYFQQDYDFAHLHLPADLRRNVTIERYESGHMIYIDPASLAKLKADLDRWYDGH